MNIPSNIVSSVTPTDDRAKAVESTLCGLRDVHRLALHVVEHNEAMFAMSQATIDGFSTPPLDTIDTRLKQRVAPLHSFTLLPSTNSGVTTRPFNVFSDLTHNYSYLFDFSQTQPHPPRVVRAHQSTLCSQYSSSHKILRLYEHNWPTDVKPYLPEFKAFYEQYKKGDEQEWTYRLMDEAGDPNAVAFTSEQLDMLGKAYEQRRIEPRSRTNPTVMDFNEVVACANTSHIAAIAITDYVGGGEPDPKLHEECLKLQAALVGLDHLAHDIDLPVVIYHVDGAKQGHIEYVGQTRRELTLLACEALGHIGEKGIRKMGNLQYVDCDNVDFEPMHFLFKKSPSLRHLAAAIQRYLKIDIQNGSTEREWCAAANDAADLIRSDLGPAPQSHQTSPASGGR
jgi:hypothetical protein